MLTALQGFFYNSWGKQLSRIINLRRTKDITGEMDQREFQQAHKHTLVFLAECRCNIGVYCFQISLIINNYRQ